MSRRGQTPKGNSASGAAPERHRRLVAALDRIGDALELQGKRHGRAEFWKAFREWITLAALVGTLVFTGTTYLALRGQLALQKRQLDADETHFTMDERPVLAFDHEHDPPPVGKEHGREGMGYIKEEPSHPVFWDYALKNYGKSTAFNVRIQEYISLGGGPFATPGAAYDRPLSDIVPTQSYWTTAYWPGPVSLADFAKYTLMPRGIILRVLAKYDDAQGNHYTTDLCYYSNSNMSLSGCISSDFKDRALVLR